MKTLSYPRLALLAGVILLFVSLFLEWYSFQVVDITYFLNGQRIFQGEQP
ncbi:hypothetical protein ES705_11625 [subsurface metagenome]